MKCNECGERLVTRPLAVYEDDTLIGLPHIFIINAAVQRWCDKCQRECGVAIPDEEGLAAAVAMERLHIPVKLVGREIRFLRRAIEYPAKGVAKYLQTTQETVSRWENNRLPISPQYDKLFRLRVADRLVKLHPWVSLNLDLEALHSLEIPTQIGEPPIVRMAFARMLAKPAADQPAHETWCPKADAA